MKLARALAFAASLLMFERARADELTAHYDPGALVEHSHHIQATLYPGYAELLVDRELFNGGKQADEATYSLELPRGAVAVGLETRGPEPGAAWQAGELLDAQLAAGRYAEFTGRAHAIRHVPGLLAWESYNQLSLRVFPCQPGKSQWFRYKLLVPLSYADGRHTLKLDALGLKDKPPSWTVRPGRQGDSVSANGFTLSAGASLSFQHAGTEPLLLALSEGREASITGSFASVSLGSKGSVVRGSWTAAPRLSTTPVGARILILLDGSRSMRPDVFASYRGILPAYLQHFEQAQVAIVAFDRTARAVTAGWVSPEQALEALSSWPSTLANGSQLDDALSTGRQLLQSAGPGERRALILTDAQTRSSLSVATIGRALSLPRTLVHLATVSFTSYSNYVSPDGFHPWLVPVEATGGQCWSASYTPQEPATTQAAVFEEWARPLRYRLESLHVGTKPLETPEYALDEGQGFVFEHVVEGRPAEMTLRASLWGHHLTLRAQTNFAAERRTAAFAVMDPGSTGLDPETDKSELSRLAFLGRAVSAYTSYLTVEPGVRPPTAEQHKELGLGLSGVCDCGGSHSRDGWIGIDTRPQDKAWLTERLRTAQHSCHADSRAVTWELETTVREVVDVRRVGVEPAEPVAQRCLTEAAWALDLPEPFGWIRQEKFLVSLSGQ